MEITSLRRIHSFQESPTEMALPLNLIGKETYMFVPEFFHGKFSDIEKKLKPLRSRNKTLDAVRNLYDVINQTMSKVTVKLIPTLSMPTINFHRKSNRRILIIFQMKKRNPMSAFLHIIWKKGEEK